MARENRWSTDGRGNFPLLLVLLLAAFFLRSVLLDKQSLWGDEAYSLSMASRSSWESVLNEVLSGDAYTPHTPLYYLGLMPWLKLVGSNDFALRWFSVAFGLLTVPVSYVLARRFIGKREASIVALLLALSPFLVYYSQEARMYAMSGFLATLMVYSFLRGVVNDERRWRIAYAVSAIALVFTLNLGLVLIVALLLASLLSRAREAKMRSIFVCHIPIALTFLVWQMVQSSRFEMTFSLVPLQAIVLLSLDALKDNVLAHSFGVTLDRAWYVDRVYAFRDDPLQSWLKVVEPYYTTVLAAGALGLAYVGGRRLSRAKSPISGFLLLGIAAVIVSVLLLRLTTPGYAVRLTLIASPLFLILLGAGILAIPGPFRALVLALFVAAAGYSLWQYYENPVYSRSEYRTLARYLGEEVQDGDAVYLHSPVLRILQSHYATKPYPTYTLPRSMPVNYNWEEVDAQLKSLAEQHPRLWIILGGETDYDPDRRVERWLLEHGYQVENRWFGNARLSLFAFPKHSRSKVFAGRTMGDNLALIEYELNRDQPLAPGQDLPISFVWKRLSPELKDYRLSLRLLDAEQVTWTQRDLDLGTYLNPVSHWPVKQPVPVRTGLRLPPGIPPGSYTLKILVYEPKGQPLPGGDLEAAQVRVGPGPLGLARRLRPPNQVDIALGPLHIAGYHFPQRVTPGRMALLRLYWHARQTTGEDYSLIVRLGTEPEKELPLLPDYPTSRWREGEGVISQHWIRIPASSAGSQPLSIGLAGQNGSELHPLTRVEIEAVRRSFEVPFMQRAYGVSLDGLVELMGMNVEGRVSTAEALPTLFPGESLNLSLYWKALKNMETNYSVFVQLLDSEGRLVVNDDTLPLQGERPTTGWLPEEVLRDKHQLKMPDNLQPGQYHLIAGLYDPKTGQRLIAGEKDYVHLTDALVQGGTDSPR